MLIIFLCIGTTLFYSLIAISMYHWYRDQGEERLKDALFDTDRANMLLFWLWPLGLLAALCLTIVGTIDFLCDEIFEWVRNWKYRRAAKKEASRHKT
jgi:hypothetical protein